MRTIFTAASRRWLYPFALWVGSSEACCGGEGKPSRTRYTLLLRFRFQGEQLSVDPSYDVRWGSTTEPQLAGIR